MILTYIFARVFGTYLIIAGIAVLTRRKFVMSAVGSFVGDRLGQIVIALFELFVGLLVINFHDVWSSVPAIIVSLLGWGMTLKGAFIMLAPEKLTASVVKAFDKKQYVIADGVIALLLGLYLANVGYGIF